MRFGTVQSVTLRQLEAALIQNGQPFRDTSSGVTSFRWVAGVKRLFGHEVGMLVTKICSKVCLLRNVCLKFIQNSSVTLENRI